MSTSVEDDVMAGLRAAGPSGDAAVDAAEAQRVIRSAVLKRALRRPGPEGWIGRVRLLAGLRAATARGCEPWVMAALDQGCLHLLLLGLSLPLLEPTRFALAWYMHRVAGTRLFQRLRTWFAEHLGQPGGLRGALKRWLVCDRAFLGSMLERPASDAMLVFALHEASIGDDVDMDTPLGRALWDAVYAVFGRPLYALDVPRECLMGDAWAPVHPTMGLLLAAEAYRELFQEVAQACERECLQLVAQRILWGVLRVASGVADGYNGMHVAFAALRAAEERWGASGQGAARALLHGACLGALGLGTMDGHAGVGEDPGRGRAMVLRARANMLMDCAKYAALRWLHADLYEQIDHLVPTVESLGLLMLEVQRRLPPGEGRMTMPAVLLWRAFQRHTRHQLFPLAEFRAAEEQHDRPRARAAVLLRQARYMCARYRDDALRLSLLGDVLDDFRLERAGLEALADAVAKRVRTLPRSCQAGLLLWRLFHRRTGRTLFPAEEYEQTVDAELARAEARRLEAAIRMCDRVAALCASDGARAAVDYARAWLRWRGMGYGRVAQQRRALTEALKLPEGVPAWPPLVPAVVSAGFEAVYSEPLAP